MSLWGSHTLWFPTIQVYPQKVTCCRHINNLYGLIGTICTNIDPLSTPISLCIRNSPNPLALEHVLKLLSAFTEILFLSPYVNSESPLQNLPPHYHLASSYLRVHLPLDLNTSLVANMVCYF